MLGKCSASHSCSLARGNDVPLQELCELQRRRAKRRGCKGQNIDAIIAINSYELQLEGCRALGGCFVTRPRQLRYSIWVVVWRACTGSGCYVREVWSHGQISHMHAHIGGCWVGGGRCGMLIPLLLIAMGVSSVWMYLFCTVRRGKGHRRRCRHSRRQPRAFVVWRKRPGVIEVIDC